jgi:hypothetical protein
MKKEGNENKIWYSVLVDAENSEATGQRTNGKKKTCFVLHKSNYIVYEVVPFKIAIMQNQQNQRNTNQVQI